MKIKSTINDAKFVLQNYKKMSRLRKIKLDARGRKIKERKSLSRG